MPIPAHYDQFESAVPWKLVIGERNRRQVKHWVELGAGYGHQSAVACDYFSHVYAVELIEEVYCNQCRELVSSPNAMRLLGSSTEHLTRILEDIGNNPAIWFIDSHYPGMGPKRGPECPLLDELNILRKCGRLETDVLFIDNAGLFERPPPPPHDPSEWPSIDDIVNVLGWCERVSDTIIRGPQPIWQSYSLGIMPNAT